MKNTVSIAALCAIATAAVLGFGAARSEATVSCDRYAATTGSDTAAGTSSAPFRTAQKLADSLSAGQTGCLNPGVYNENLRLNHGGAPGSPIRLTSAPGGRATLVGRLYVPDSSNDAVFADLNLVGTNADNLSSPMVAGDRITFTGNDVTDNHTSICFGLGSDSGWGTAVDVVIDNNRIHDCGRLPATNHDHGIYVESTRNAVITNNYIYDNADRGIQLYPDAQGTKIANNVIDGNGEGVLFSGDSGLASSNNVVTRNIVSNAVVRYNVESWWPDGNPVGTGNTATENCVWNGAQGNVAAQVGFTASGNKAVNPLYTNRAAKNFQLQSGSPCAGYGPDVTTTPAATPPPPPPATPVSPPANMQAPAVFGTARTGGRLTASSGAWSGTPTFAYSWQRCDRNGGACAATSTTGSVFALTNADVGYTLRVVVRAQNSAGSPSATSAQTAVVQADKGRKGAVRTFKSSRLQSRRALHRLARTVHR
ncbi:MAG TPA: right-handed parallel beta-helix repeat-containing protein [Gaiellaceae bacterium]|nr:right-handed parallel beta-helix repeat-containing protein [Gaiellaceae bacterium]